MKNIVIVAPFIGKTMRQCLTAFAGLEDTKIGIISQQPEEALPAGFQQRIFWAPACLRLSRWWAADRDHSALSGAVGSG